LVHRTKKHLFVSGDFKSFSYWFLSLKSHVLAI